MTKDEQTKPAPDIARLRAQSERRFVIRCSTCNRQIARSAAAQQAGWLNLDSGPNGPHPRCPDCAQESERVATCTSCGSKVAASAAADFGWRYWQEKHGKPAHYCAACAIKLLTDH